MILEKLGKVKQTARKMTHGVEIGGFSRAAINDYCEKLLDSGIQLQESTDPQYFPTGCQPIDLNSSRTIPPGTGHQPREPAREPGSDLDTTNACGYV